MLIICRRVSMIILIWFNSWSSGPQTLTRVTTRGGRHFMQQQAVDLLKQLSKYIPPSLPPSLHIRVSQKRNFFDYFCKLTNCALGPPKYLGQIPTNSEKFQIPPTRNFLHRDLSQISAQLINLQMKSKNVCIFWDTLLHIC